MPPRIRDPGLLRLLGDLLAREIQPTAAGTMRMRLMQPGFSWQSLITLATEQEVLPPLARALAVNGLLLPVPRSAREGTDHVTARIEEAYRSHLARRQAECGQLERMLRALNAAGIAPLLLKGARYLKTPAGPWSQARAMRDFDLLVHPQDATPAIAALQSAGYRSDPPEALNHHHYPPMRSPAEPLGVELHSEALAAAGQKIMSTAHVWQHAQKADDGSCFVMPPRWQALHCVLHHQISDHGFSRRILAIKALWEWTMLAHDFSSGDWESVITHMGAARAPEVLDSWLAQTQQLFGVQIPSCITISSGARAQAEATFRLAAAPHWRRRARFIAGQLRFSFGRESLALRYGLSASEVSPRETARYVGHLLRLHRGRIWRRLIGHQDRMS